MNQYRLFLFFFSILPFFSVNLLARSSVPVRSQNVEARLISEYNAIVPGQSIKVGLFLKMDPGWHTYWQNPGDAGLPTKIDWNLPSQFLAGKIKWPRPRQLKAPPFMSYGYKERVLLPVIIKTSKKIIPGEMVKLRARASWLECKELCLPGKADLELILPVKSDNKQEIDAYWHSRLKKTEALIPKHSHPWKINSVVQDNLIQIDFKSLHKERILISYFFPHQDGIIIYAAKQKVSNIGNVSTIYLKRKKGENKTIKHLSGVILTRNQKGDRPEAYRVDIINTTDPVSSESDSHSMGLSLAIFFAFIGGIILNLMPCVLPVISLKAMNFIQQSGESRMNNLMHGLVYTGGIVISFWILAGTLLLLRAGGEELGWGFQLQSPYFVSFLSLFIFIFALNMLGVFEIGTSLIGVGSKFLGKNGMSSSFMSGVLATIVATPCTAPFMGSALGYAISQPPHAAMMIFSSLGLGMAFPILLLSGFPVAFRMLPKPGAWMESLKQFMGFLLLATIIWLLWVLIRLTDEDVLSWFLLLLLLLGLGGWIMGRWTQPTKSLRVKISARITVLVIFLAAFFINFLIIRNVTGKIISAENIRSDKTDGWVTFSPKKLAELRGAGKAVFIDFTADWCLSCKVNEKIALNREKVQKRFKELDVALLKADWTRHDPVITRMLHSFGRSGVPLYVLYGPGEIKPQILPEIITQDIMLKALDKIKPRETKNK